jgi:PKD repeat protein
MKRLFMFLKDNKKVIIVLLFLCGIFLTTTKSQTTVTIEPDNTSWWTGRVYYVAGTYSDQDDELRIGHALVSGNYRAYAAFRITDIPNNAIITYVSTGYYVSNPGGSNHHCVMRALSNNPMTTSGQILYDDIGDGAWFAETYDMQSEGWKYNNLSSEAINDLQNAIDAGKYYWAIGYYEDEDNDPKAVVSGYSYDNPYCEVTYILPDLIVQNQNGDPLTLNAGESMSLSCDVCNQGQGTADPSILRYYLSDNTTYSSDDDELGYDNIDLLTSGECSSKSEDIIVPIGTNPGTWYILFFTDADNEISEENEDNNIEYVEITIVDPVFPIADFIGVPIYIQTGDSVQFSDESTGDPTLWEWIFEGGDPPNYDEQNPPLITYNIEGDYDVSLTVTNANGSDTEIKYEYIHVSTYPPTLVADFEGDPTSIQVGEFVEFDDLSSGNPTSWEWTFTGGTPDSWSGQTPPDIIYNDEGSWDVTLYVTNDSGEEDTKTIPGYINVGITYLQIGDLKIYADNIDNLSGSLYEVSGNVSINHIIKFDNSLFVDINELTIVGDYNCSMYLDNSTGFTPPLPLYYGEFGFDVIGSTLYNSNIGGNNSFTMTLLDVNINDIEVIDDGIIINGEIILPEIMGNLAVDINQVTLEFGDIDFEGVLQIYELMIFNTFVLNNLELQFDTYNDNFSGEAKMEFYNGLGLQVGAVIQQGKLDSIGVRVGFPIAIPGTGFQFNEYGGSVFGLAYPPLKLYFVTNIEAVGSFDVVELNNLNLLYTWGTSIEGGGDLLVFNSNVASMFMQVTSNVILFQGSVTIVPNSQYVLGDIEACLTSYNNTVDFAGSLYACLQIPDNNGFPFGLIRCFVDLPYIVAQTDNYIHNTNLSGNFSILSFNGHYQLEYQNPGIDANFGVGWIDLDKALFSDEDLVYNPQLAKINRLEGVSLLVSESNPNSLLSINEGNYIQTFSLESPSSTLVIRLFNNLNAQPFSIVLPDSTIVTPENFEQIANVEFLTNEEINKTYYIINNPQQGMWTVNIENTSDSLVLDIFSKSVSPTLQLNETINLNDSIQISWSDSDIDSDANISLYYDNDNHGANGRKIIDGISENDIVDLYNWNIDSIPTGNYYVYGIIDDFVNNPSISYSPNPVKIINKNAPEKPTDLSGSVSDSSIFLNWTYPLQDTTVRFIIYYTTDSIYPSFNSSSYNIGNRTSYEFKNFHPGRNYHFMVTAIDTNYIESNHSNIFDVAYQSGSINNAPNILSQNIPDIVYADSLYAYQLQCNDPDANDVLTYNIYCLLGSDTLIGANTIDINSNGLITWNPTMNDLGYYKVIIKVNDIEGSSDSLTYSLKVLDPTLKNIYIEVNNPLYSCFEGSCFVSVKDNTLLNSNEKIDTVHFRVYSNADPIGITLQAIETEPGSDYYRSIFEFSGFYSSGNKLLVDTTDIIVAEYINQASSDTVTDLSYFSHEPLVVNVTMIGDSIFCAGDEIDVQLIAEPANATYLWSDGITKTQTIDIIEPGYYSVLVSNEYGCIISSDTIKILPLPTPVVELSTSDTINICEGFELSPGSCEDSCFYIWNTGDTSNTILIYQPGNYNVTVTNKYHCTGYDNVYVNEVNNNPISDFSYSFGQSNIVFFENNSEFGLIYFWEFGDGYTSTMENPSHMYDEVGIYEIILNVTNNCGTSTIIKTINVTDVAEYESNTNVSVYPNPTNSYINIKIRDLELNEQIDISIIDFTGNTLKSISITNSTGYLEKSINITDLSRGIYFLKIHGKNYLTTKKIIKL